MLDYQILYIVYCPLLSTWASSSSSHNSMPPPSTQLLLRFSKGVPQVRLGTLPSFCGCTVTAGCMALIVAQKIQEQSVDHGRTAEIDTDRRRRAVAWTLRCQDGIRTPNWVPQYDLHWEGPVQAAVLSKSLAPSPIPMLWRPTGGLQEAGWNDVDECVHW